MRLIGGGKEVGFISVGQHAVGVIALGQEAVGVIAIGQMARGVIAVGQLAIGVVAIGQLAVGVGFGGMGLAGTGLVGVVPKLEPLRDYPPCTTFEAVHAGWGDGWVDAEVHVEHGGSVGLYVAGQRLPAKIAAKLIPRAKAVVDGGAGNHVLAHVRRMGPLFVCDRMMSVPIPVEKREGFTTSLVLRTIALIAMAVLVWAVALWPMITRLSQL